MPYKPSLLTTLNADYEDAARKYTEARDVDAVAAERYLYRMKLLGRNIEFTHKMIDGTMGKEPLHKEHHVHSSVASVAMPASRVTQ